MVCRQQQDFTHRPTSSHINHKKIEERFDKMTVTSQGNGTCLFRHAHSMHREGHGKEWTFQCVQRTKSPIKLWQCPLSYGADGSPHSKKAEQCQLHILDADYAATDNVAEYTKNLEHLNIQNKTTNCITF
jgi:hypothetical protein